VNREPNFDELIDAETSDAERQQLQHAHELLVQAGPPPELTPKLRKAPRFEAPSSNVRRMEPRRSVTRRALVLLAAAVAVAAVFAAGYGIGNRGGSTRGLQTLALQGTRFAPNARATLEVWHPRDGNWPMTLNVVGLRKLPPRSYYEVYLVRGGKVQLWGKCGTFRVGNSSRVLTLTLNAPYQLQKGDAWVVTRTVPGGSEPGRTVLRPATTA